MGIFLLRICPKLWTEWDPATITSSTQKKFVKIGLVVLEISTRRDKQYPASQPEPSNYHKHFKRVYMYNIGKYIQAGGCEAYPTCQGCCKQGATTMSIHPLTLSSCSQVYGNILPLPSTLIRMSRRKVPLRQMYQVKSVKFICQLCGRAAE